MISCSFSPGLKGTGTEIAPVVPTISTSVLNGAAKPQSNCASVPSKSSMPTNTSSIPDGACTLPADHADRFAPGQIASHAHGITPDVPETAAAHVESRRTSPGRVSVNVNAPRITEHVPDRPAIQQRLQLHVCG